MIQTVLKNLESGSWKILCNFLIKKYLQMRGRLSLIFHIDPGLKKRTEIITICYIRFKHVYMKCN